uniref:Wsv526-like protein n=1 Tax=Sesarmops intermedium nimavirus TaxID=2133796 RepID=A0A401IPM2_9VIRU|nr:MAG: wsv526-like protein [Sesarmops intermedium nimavirus]GBG35563.1 wsv526-like protein [Sesarmops intermedium nimavirus]
MGDDEDSAAWAKKYENRYCTEEWRMDMPSVCAMETDLNVFKSEAKLVPVKRHTNDRCLDEYKPWCPIYRVVLYDTSKVNQNSDVESISVDGTEVFPPESEFEIPPKSIAEVMIRLQRFDFRYPGNTGAVIFATGCNRNTNVYNHDGLVILPNNNFIGEFSSEIGPSVKVYNSTNQQLTYRTYYSGVKSDSPVGVLFEHLPLGKTFEAVTAKDFPSKLLIPANNRIFIQLVHARNSSSQLSREIRSCSVFYTSVGACEIPDGVFMDDITNKDGELFIYNFSDQAKEIIFREDNSRSFEENFLGYVITLPQQDIKLRAIKSTSEVLKIDLNTASVYMAYLFMTLEDFIVPPKSSIIVKLNGVKILNSFDTNNFGLLEGGQRDKSFWVMKYIKVVSLVPGIKIITPVLEYELYRKTFGQEIQLRVFNVTASAIKLAKNEHTVGGIVCQASKLTEKDSGGHTLY